MLINIMLNFSGTDPDTLFSERHPHFIGCMKNIKYLNRDGGYVPIPVTMLKGVVEGCSYLCAKNNPCHHGGRCINAYTDTICDCFRSANYQGEFCSELGKYGCNITHPGQTTETSNELAPFS